METNTEASVFDSAAYKRSRAAHTAQCAFEYFVSLILADTYLAKLLTSLGISDATAGLIASVANLSFLFELLALPLQRRIKSLKHSVITFDVLSITLFSFTYLLPLLDVPLWVRSTLAFVCVGGGFACKYIVFSFYFAWSNSFVKPNRRARFAAVKEMISLSTGVGFTLLTGYAFTAYEKAGKLGTCFTLMAVVVLALNACSFTCLMLMKKDKPGVFTGSSEKLSKLLKQVFSNKAFVRIIAMTSLWEFARCFTLGFLGTYKAGELGYTVFETQLIAIGGCMARFAVSIPFGAYSDRNSYTKGFSLALVVAAVSFACCAFASPSARWLIIAYTLLYNICLAGAHQNSYNLAYSYIKPEHLIQSMAIKDCVAGISGFLSAFVASRLLAGIQANGNTFLSVHIYGQQVLAFVSLLLTALTLLYIKKRISNLPVMKQ